MKLQVDLDPLLKLGDQTSKTDRSAAWARLAMRKMYMTTSSVGAYIISQYTPRGL